MNAADEKVWRAAARVAGKGERIQIADVWKNTKGMSLTEVHRALLNLQIAGKLVLMRNDNPRDVSERDEHAKLMVGGFPRHLLYLEQLPPSAAQGNSTVNSKTRAALIKKIDSEIEKKVTSEMATRKPAKKRRAKKRAKKSTHHAHVHHVKRSKTKRASKKRKSHKREATVTLEGLQKGQYKTWTCKGRVRSGCGGGGRVVH